MVPGRSPADLARWKLGRLLGQRNYTPFLIGGRSRSGSYMLISMLEAHPTVYAQGELCGRLRGRSVDRILDRVYGRYPAAVRAAGFKAFYYHPLDDESGRMWQRLTAMSRLRVVHLTRRNILRTLVSRKIAGNVGQWMLKGTTPAGADAEPRSVSFATDELQAQFERTTRWQNEFRERFRDHPLLEVVYEDLVADRTAEFRRITDFLGVESALPRTDTRRQNPEPLPELISNYYELKHAFSGTAWESHFDE